MAVELIGELETIDRNFTAADKELRQLVTDRGSTLADLHGIGPACPFGKRVRQPEIDYLYPNGFPNSRARELPAGTRPRAGVR
ncbi:hypothetical protein ACFYO7_07355 [Nocardia salmonicida]|uniref:hypothetical protein n=1 Tax=Nocardia salmonicida TaxID=53431 RepID=UPI0036C48731